VIKELQTSLQNEWDRCSKWLQDALDVSGNLATLDQVKALVDKSRAKFWFGKECAFVTEIVQFPNKRALNIWLAGGDLQELLTFKPEVHKYAKDRECDIVLIQGGRPGWHRVIKHPPRSVCVTYEV
jgi:hypothetical protein